jgi:hypothetical protein
VSIYLFLAVKLNLEGYLFGTAVGDICLFKNHLYSIHLSIEDSEKEVSGNCFEILTFSCMVYDFLKYGHWLGTGLWGGWNEQIPNFLVLGLYHRFF